MKEQITKFDLADAFKALDDIATPSVQGIRANRMDLTEATKRVDRLSMLVEDYYNIQDQTELQQASNDIQADVAKAKLAKIEKIVDLDAETPDDIQPSYVGKTIIQCPQCMTLFYKDPVDIEKSEEDPTTVNVGEICQHCGNDSGYTLVGKVAEETPEEIPAEEPTTEEAPAEEELPEVDVEEEATETTEEIPAEEEELSLDFSEEEPAKQESLHRSNFLKDAEKDIMNTKFHSENLTLNEDLDKDMDQFNAYIDYLQAMLKQDEEALERAKKMKDNELAVQIIEKRIAADKEDLEAALPQVVKDKQNEEELPTAEEVADDLTKNEAFEESVNKAEANEGEMDTENHSENLSLNEENLEEGKLGDIISRHKDLKASNEVDKAIGNSDPTAAKKLGLKRRDAENKKAHFKANSIQLVFKDSQGKQAREDMADLAAATDSALRNSANGKTCYIVGTLIGGKEEVLQKYQNGKLINDAFDNIIKKASNYAVDDFEATTNQEVDNTDNGDFEVNATEETTKEEKPAEETAAPEAPKAEEEKPAEEPVTPATEEASAETGEEKPAETAATPTDNRYDIKKVQAAKENNNKILKALKAAGMDTTALEGKKNQKLQAIRKALFGEALEAEDLTEDAIVDEAKKLQANTDVTDAEIDHLLDSKEYETPISDQEVLGYLKAGLVEESLDNVTDINDKAINECISSYLTEVYSNVENFTATNCTIDNNNIILEGVINFKSGKTKPTTFELVKAKDSMLEGFNKDLGGKTSKFQIKYFLESNSMILPTSMAYSYKIDNTLVEGFVERK